MKKHLLLIAVAICFLPSLTISQVIEWQNTIGGNDFDDLRSIRQTNDGGYILIGTSRSAISGDKTENSMGNYDYWIVKTDASGSIQWQNTIGGGADDYAYSVEQTSDGGYILGGHTGSGISGDKTENCIGSFDYWILKTDSVGNIQWQNTIGGSYREEFYSIKQTTDGGYILGGWSKSSISGDKTENSFAGSSDYWIVKTDASGNIQWQNTIGGNGDDELHSVGQTADGGYILGGCSWSDISGDKTENSYGGGDYWMVKIDSSGVIQWQNTIGGTFGDNLYSIMQTSDGGYILGGYSNSNISGDKTENCIGNMDYWIVKTDASGNIQWQNTIGGALGDLLYSIEQTFDGGFILGGYSLSNISVDKTENCSGGSDYWIVKTDTTGNILWQNTIGGNDDDYLEAIQQTADGGCILGGFSLSGISGDKTENSNGGYDCWIVKITDHYNLISGKLFIDTNSNNSQDAGELAILNRQVIETNTTRFGFSGLNGHYGIAVLDSGNFSVSPTTINYYTAVPITHSASFTGIQQTDSLNDFAFQPTGVFNDLCVSITPLSPFRAGINASYLINYENVGTTTLNPTVIFFPDNDVSFVSAIPVANVVTLDSVFWNFGPLAPFQQGSILVTVYVTTGTPVGTLINSWTRIEPLAGDANPSCNVSYWEVFTTGSYDPNDIVVNEDTLLTTQFPTPPYLEYIIRFQNTGNDTAFTVKVLNPIDTFKLELSTIEFVTSSHPVNLTWIPYERNMEFRFENILLPDSNINEPASHGFVRYRAKPKSTLTAGDSIANNAAIYFDFNAPVITNTAVTQVVLPTSLHEMSATANQLVLYPNPANSTLTIETSNWSGSECRLVISDVTGRTQFSKLITTASTKHKLDISSLSRGIYFVQLLGGERISRGMFVKD